MYELIGRTGAHLYFEVLALIFVVVIILIIVNIAVKSTVRNEMDRYFESKEMKRKDWNVTKHNIEKDIIEAGKERDLWREKLKLEEEARDYKKKYYDLKKANENASNT